MVPHQDQIDLKEVAIAGHQEVEEKSVTLTVAGTILQETCHQEKMAASEMMDHQEDSTVDPQEAEASGTEAASEIEVDSEVVTETRKK